MGLRPRNWRGPKSTALVFLLILCGRVALSEANRLPKFPTASKTIRDALKSSSTRSVQSDSSSSAESQNRTLPLHPTAGDQHKKSSSRSQEEGQKGEEAERVVAIDQDIDKSLQASWAKATTKNTSEEPAGTVLVKARLKSTDVLKKGSKKKDPHAKLMTGGKHTHQYNYTEHRVQRSGRMDIVLTHYDIGRTEEMVNYWLNFLQMEKVQQMKPYVFIYCQNDQYDLDEDDFRPILQLGGEIQHLPNVGRESHAYLEHITKHYNDLADYTIFAQDQSDIALPERFEMLFEPGRTGFLPLSLVGHVDCDDPFLPAGVIPQIYAMFANELCPPVGYTSSFEGQFVVSKPRIQKNSWWTYTRLLDVLSADESHWIHQTHDNQHYKTKSNPMFGHVLERSWSIAFDCFESWREGNCWHCIAVQGMHNCGDGDCQCFDRQ